MFSFDWNSIGRILVVGSLAYLGLVLFLRISGKRTLSKLNAFDLVITVSIGSTLATILLDKKVSLSQGLTAFFVLIMLQYVITKSSVASDTVSKLIKSNPTVLFLDGEYIKKNMDKERVKKQEILQAVRSQGLASMQQVKAVILETDGSLSVIKDTDTGEEDAIKQFR
ncbi:YetF domain-containing protein [Bacillus sp. FJAT-27251]|uniref:DUF421 domain-containing protein n=1 Tax=Bacillus sp. FJAT-27251 TaxID=1684142 RepID=UPI0006A7E77D|nr:YetF domain-containing protein [Bacillus sp. FJAT-27251]